MNKHHLTPGNASGEKDDFQGIKGIGNSIAKALYQSGIHRYAELALFTPEELSERLSNIIAFVPTQRIEKDDWVGQARELAKKKIKPVVQKQPVSDWHELADFIVSFGELTIHAGTPKIQTRIHYTQGYQSEEWDGIATDTLIPWMLTHANLPGQPPAETAGAKKEKHKFLVPESELEEDVELILTDLWVSQVSIPSQEGGSSPQKQVRVDGNLHLDGPDASSLTYERVPFSIEFYLVNMETNHSTLATTYTGNTEPNHLIYTFQQNFPIPERGRYQLFVTSRLLAPFTAEAQLQGPVLRVGIQ